MAKKKTPSTSGERVFRVWVHTSPKSDSHNTYDVVAERIEKAASRARGLAMRAGFSEPCVRKAEQISIID